MHFGLKIRLKALNISNMESKICTLQQFFQNLLFQTFGKIMDTKDFLYFLEKLRRVELENMEDNPWFIKMVHHSATFISEVKSIVLS